MLTALAALAHGEGMVDAQVIEEHAWRGTPSPRSLQSAIYRLRSVMGSDAVETRRRTVRLSSAVAVDLDEFLSTGVDAAGRQAALDLVRGIPFQTMEDHPAWRTLRGAWEQRIAAVRDASLDAMIAAGEHAEAIGLLAEQLAANPQVSGHWVRMVDSLTALGRRVDALRAVDHARRALADAGLDLDESLLQRERSILAGDTGYVDRSVQATRSHPTAGARPAQGAASALLVGRENDISSIVDTVNTTSMPAVVVRARVGLGGRSVCQAAVSRLADEGWRIVTVPAQIDNIDQSGALRLICHLLGYTTDELAVDSFDVADAARHVGGRTLLVYGSVNQGPRQVWDALVVAATLAGDALRLFGSDANHQFDTESPSVAFVDLRPLPNGVIAQIAGDKAVALLGENELALLTGGGPGYAHDVGTAVEADTPLYGIILQIVNRRIAALSPSAARLLALVAIVGGRLNARIAARAFGWSIAEVEAETRLLADHGFAMFGAGDVEIVIDRWLAMRVGDVLPLAVRIDVKNAVIELLGNDTRSLWMRSRAQLAADPIDGWRTVMTEILTVGEVEVERDPETLIALIDSALPSLSRSPEVERTGRPRLLSRRAMAKRLLGQLSESWIDAAAAHRDALRAGDAELQLDLIRESNYPALVAATDDGEQVRRLADSFAARPGLNPQLRVQVDAIRAFHQYARGMRSTANSMAEGLLVEAQRFDDPKVARRVASTIACDVLYDRSRTSEAAFSVDAERAAGSFALASRAMVYLLCGRMRAGESTFDDPLMDDMYLLCDPNQAAITEVRLAAVQLAAAVLGVQLGRTLTVSNEVSDRFESPLRSAARRAAVQFVLRRDWTNIPAHQMFGDPAAYRISAPLDVGLWDAATACAAGDTASARNFLATLSEPVVDYLQSSMVVTRLPLVTAVARAVGDRDLAAALLEINLGLSGTDVCHLPAAHLGPADSWLADLAETAADPRAARLHESAAARLAALGANVLELS